MTYEFLISVYNHSNIIIFFAQLPCVSLAAFSYINVHPLVTRVSGNHSNITSWGLMAFYVHCSQQAR